MNHVALIILTFNQREKTLKCLDSLYASTTSRPAIVVWDNGSEDETAVAIRQSHPQVLVHESQSNLGVAGGRNAAAALAIQTYNPAYLLFLDNDILVEPDFIEALYYPFTENTRVGQTQAKLRFMHDPVRLNDGGGNTINFTLGQFLPVGFNEIDRGQYDTIKPCISCGGAMMVRRDVFELLGGFDAIFNPFGPEDADFSLRLQKAGYSALYVPQAIAYHEVSHTFGKGYSEEYARYKSRHWLTFMRRHATPAQKLSFYAIGTPYLGVKVFIREARRGNLGAIRGILKGLFDKS
ncbi:MAG: glycosyltransferase family 2 protein [Chloroflexota bacterium]